MYYYYNYILSCDVNYFFYHCREIASFVIFSFQLWNLRVKHCLLYYCKHIPFCLKRGMKCPLLLMISIRSFIIPWITIDQRVFSLPVQCPIPIWELIYLMTFYRIFSDHFLGKVQKAMHYYIKYLKNWIYHRILSQSYP